MSAFTYDISANSGDSDQSNPAWVLTFVRWANRLPSEYSTPAASTVRDPLVVVNDCVDLTTSGSKSSHTQSMSAMLLPTNVNYETAIAPGDFVFVNICKTEKKAEEIAQRAAAQKPINLFQDGFRGLFKVQSVRRVLAMDPSSGTKRVMFQVQGYAFTELNNTIYFNPHVISNGERSTSQLFVSQISDIWRSYLGDLSQANVQTLVKLLFELTLGKGVGRSAREFSGILQSPNVHFLMPTLVSSLLGVNRGIAAKDIYNLLMGIQTYGSAKNPQIGFNPLSLKRSNNIFTTKTACQGTALLGAEYWNQVTAWSLLNQYLNDTVNELYTAFRVDPDGFVMPTIVMRQKPFSSEKYKGTSTKFLNLPRWRVDAELLRDVNIGRDEALRINYVQVFGIVTQAANPEVGISDQIARGNYVFDIKDVQRSGLKPYIRTSNFDFIGDNIKNSQATTWTRLLADMLIGGHLKLSGSITCMGIEEPITHGDNLELEGIVYHIESVSHSASYSPDGRRSFRTTLHLSNGVDKRDNKKSRVFGEMDYPRYEDYLKNDNNNEQILPGQSWDQKMVSDLDKQPFNPAAVVRNSNINKKTKTKKNK